MAIQIKTWQAIVTGMLDSEEVINLLTALKNTTGKLLSVRSTATGVQEFVFQLEDEDSVAVFDIIVCDLGYDIEWEGEV